MQIKIMRHSERFDHKYLMIPWVFYTGYFGYYWSDSPLTTNGHNLAREKGRKMIGSNFNPTHIYSSPYDRTLATSTEIQSSFPQSKIVIEPLLAEHQPKYKHKINLYPNGVPTLYDGSETEYSYPENYDSFTSRVHFILKNLIDKHDTDFIIVTHGEIVKVLVNYVQSLFPELMLDSGTTPYLTTLSFTFDKNTNQIVKESVSID